MLSWCLLRLDRIYGLVFFIQRYEWSFVECFKRPALMKPLIASRMNEYKESCFCIMFVLREL